MLPGNWNLQNPNPDVEVEYALFGGGYNNGRIDLNIPSPFPPEVPEEEQIDYLKKISQGLNPNKDIKYYIVKVTTKVEVFEI